MCGRFLLTAAAERVAEHFGLDDAPPLSPRFNVAPGQTIALVRLTEAGGRELAVVLWGLVPSWSRDAASGHRPINARAETAAEKPTFRTPFRRRRCLVPADGFYEWKPDGKRKRPHAFRLPGGAPFAMAGLWDRWLGPDGSVLDSSALLTTEANDLVRPVHDRMPVILAPEHYAAWLDPRLAPADLQPLLRPFPAGQMTVCPLTTWVSDPRHEGPRCLEPEPALPDPFSSARPLSSVSPGTGHPLEKPV